MKYVVTVYETIAHSVTVTAESASEAEDLAKDIVENMSPDTEGVRTMSAGINTALVTRIEA